MNRTIAVVAVFGAIVSLHPRAIAAQRIPDNVATRGAGWLPRSGGIETTYFKSPQDLPTVLRTLAEIERVFLQIDGLAHPEGFEIEPSYTGMTPNESVLGYSLYWTFYVPTRKIAGEGTSCVRVLINYVPGAGINGMEGYADDRGKYFFESSRGTPIPGATHVWNGLSPTERSWLDVVFTTGNVSPLEPVTRERFQRAKVVFFERFLNSVQSETPYDKWMAEAPQRKADREAVRASLPPEQAAAVLKSLEDAEREATQSLKAADAADREENTRIKRIYRGMADRAREQLAALPAAERPTEAWIERRSEPPPGVNPTPGDLAPLVPRETPLAARVVVPRPEFYQGQRSPVRPRFMEVHLSASLTCNHPIIQRVMYEASRKLDWAALARIVEGK